MEKRLFIVSNQLPGSTVEGNHQPTDGEPVTAIKAFLDGGDTLQFSKIYWVGIPNCSTATWSEAFKDHPNVPVHFLPVFATPSLIDGYYSGLSHSLLWPLFHYFPSLAEYNVDHYSQYQQVNERFLHTLIKYLLPGDTVWVHDYHLMLLPHLLRKEIPELTIGFFLHIPFPSYEIFRLLPRQWQAELLNGMLGADMLGFQTIDCASYFLQSIQMAVGLDHDRHIILYNDRLIKVDVFPVSIDHNYFSDLYHNEKVQLLRQSLLQRAEDKKIIFSVDTLDYTKGINNRLKAFEYFLLHNPQYREKVIFVLVIVPSRDIASKYRESMQVIDQSVSQINSTMGNIHWQPVVYQNAAPPFEEMMALYSGCHLALVTPLRDGMNLVAKEFVASRKDKRGVLVISERAGAAKELTDALVINPNDIIEMANAIKIGLEMPEDEQAMRLETMQNRIAGYNVYIWAEDFLNEMNNIKRKQQEFQIKFLDDYSKRNLLDNYRKAKNRLLLLDYDGTLKPFTSTPAAAIPDGDLLQLLRKLNSEKNTVYLISGRGTDWLDQWFSQCNINMVAEHGARIKSADGGWTTEVIMQNEWKEPVKQIMEAYVRRCAHSFVEEKDFSMVWHYRNASPDQGKLRAAELINELNEFTQNRELKVFSGKKIIEVKYNNIDKGSAVKKILRNDAFDFILAIGDDYTDEDMFKLLAHKENSYTIKVGNEASFASFNLYTPHMVVSLLETISYITE